MEVTNNWYQNEISFPLIYPENFLYQLHAANLVKSELTNGNY